MRLNSGTENGVVRRGLLAGGILAATILIPWAIVHYGEAFIAGSTYRQPNAASTVGAPPSSPTAGFFFFPPPSALPQVRFTDGAGPNCSPANSPRPPLSLPYSPPPPAHTPNHIP